jgi:hypothetical protein
MQLLLDSDEVLKNHHLEGGFIGRRVLTVYFGTPNMFVTLWFGFNYGTNPPLGTLII